MHKSSYTCEWATCQRRGLPQTSRFALISHIRSHTGEKPFTCSKPGKLAPLRVRSSKRRTHLFLLSIPFKLCSLECDKSFTRSDALAKHMRLQHNIEPPAPGRGGNRKRKRGAEEPSSSTPAMQGNNQPSSYPSSSSLAGPSGFTTFKVEPLTPSELIDDITLITQRDRDYFNGPSYANGRPQRSSPSPRNRLPVSSYTSLPFPVSGHSNGNEDEGDPSADTLPEYLAQQLDPKTGLVKGRTPTMVMYLLTKAKYRCALEKHNALMEELKETKQELKRSRDDKERVLNDVLRTCFG